MSFQFIGKSYQNSWILPGALFTHFNLKIEIQVNKIMATVVLFFLFVCAVPWIQAQYYPAYEGLLPAQIAPYELAGLDLYMDTLLQFALLCITIALGIPLLKLDLIQNLLSNLIA